MPGTITIPKWITLTWVWSSEGTQKVNVFSYSYDGSSSVGPSVSELNQLAQDFHDSKQAQMRACQGTGCNLDRVEARWLGSEPHKYGEFVPTNFEPGTQAGELDPGNAAICGTVKTGFMGRKYRGRNYIGGFTENVTQGSTALSSLIIAAGSIMLAVKNYTGTTPCPVHMVVASRKWLFLTDVISIFVNSAIDSQRRRLIGRGR